MGKELSLPSLSMLDIFYSSINLKMDKLLNILQVNFFLSLIYFMYFLKFKPS